MSRSYKKNLFIKEGYGSKYKKIAKRSANKKVKNEEHVLDGGFYKKIFNSWDICDWKFKITDTSKKGRSK